MLSMRSVMIRPLPLTSGATEPKLETILTMAFAALPASRNFSGSTTVATSPPRNSPASSSPCMIFSGISGSLLSGISCMNRPRSISMNPRIERIMLSVSNASS